MNSLLEKYRVGKLTVKEAAIAFGKIFQHGDDVKSNNSSAIVTLSDEGAESCNNLIKRADYLVIKSGKLDALPVSVEEFDLSASQAAGMDKLNKEITVGNFSYSNIKKWISSFSHKDKVRFAVYSAELVIDLYSGASDAPKKAIQAAKIWIDNPTKENQDACRKASAAASAAAFADYAFTSAAADYAVAVASAAASAAAASASADYAFTSAAAASAAVSAAASDYAAIKQKIIKWIVDFNENCSANAKARTESEYQTVVKECERAIKSLVSSGFADNGGELWKPPVNEENGRLIKKVISLESELESLKQDKQPKKTVEYVKCDDSIFDLKDEFESGNLYYVPNVKGNYRQIPSVHVLCNCAANGCIYRRTEVEIDWRESLLPYADIYNGSIQFHSDMTDKQMVCAAHQIAELTDKPE